MSEFEDCEDEQYMSSNDELNDEAFEEKHTDESDSGNNESGGWITLNGCGKVTRWQYPDISQCVDAKCRLEFESQSDAIEHYKSTHANDAILCYICEKPIHAKEAEEFKSHYAVTHPEVPVPFSFEQTNNCRNQDTEAQEYSSEEMDEEDDLIRLSGCDKITCWLFPKHMKKCPIRICNLTFQDRSAAIDHYKQKHAENSIFCFLCERPILAFSSNDFRQHYSETHPNMEMDLFFGDESEDEQNETNERDDSDDDDDSNDESSDDSNDEVDNLITLEGLGITTQWRFPKYLKRCPINRCRMPFQTLSDVVTHYRMEHANDSILCPVCNIPVRVRWISNLKSHYRIHPNEEIPYTFQTQGIKNKKKDQSDDLIKITGLGKTSYWKFPEYITKCPRINCGTKFRNRDELIAHYREKHATKSFLCFICNKPFCAKSRLNVKEHFARKHPSQKVPFIRYTRSSESEDEHRMDDDNSKDVDQSTGKMNNVDDLITLSGNGNLTTWQFPENLKRCPVFTCNKEYADRADAIAHYKERHAMNAMLCSVCDKPIATTYPGAFMQHYRKVHPDMPLPVDLHKSIITPKNGISKNDIPKKNVNQLSVKKHRNNDESSGIVTLTACGITTYWKFPDSLTKCPVMNCSLPFGTRQAAIAHYKEQHANGSILCEICDKPIRTQKYLHTFVSHYERCHSDYEIPYEQVKHQKKTRLIPAENIRKLGPKGSNSDQERHNEDELITLKGCGRITYWKFPEQLKQCPLKKCNTEFDGRAEAIAHYKEHHAMDAILCPVCDKPIAAANIKNFTKHYERIHPNEPLPDESNVNRKDETNHMKSTHLVPDDDYITLTAVGITTRWKFPKFMTKCPVTSCRIQFKNRSEAKVHYENIHARGSILCAICDRPIRAGSGIKNFSRHYEKKHPSVECPYGLNGKRTKSQNKLIPVNESKSVDSVNDEEQQSEDDLITLSGQGHITHWKFPKCLRKCPIRKCKHNAKHRSEAIAHFREEHAKLALLCPICEKPIILSGTTHFAKHYEQMHPGNHVPVQYTSRGNNFVDVEFQGDTNSPGRSGKKQKKDKDDDDDDDDLIILKGSSKIVKWRFPSKTTRCPTAKCYSNFDTRSKTIEHFRKVHAIHYTLCPQCNKLICGTKQNLSKHFTRFHSNEQQTLATAKKSTPYTRQIVCPLKECKYKTTNMHNLRTHWTKKHSSLRFPEIRDGSAHSYDKISIEQKDNSKPKQNNEKMDVDSDDSLLQPKFVVSSSSDESESDENVKYQVRKNKLKRMRLEKRTRKNHNYSSSCSDNETGDSEDTRKRKLVIQRNDDMPDETLESGGNMIEFEWPMKLEPVSSEPEEDSFIITNPSNEFTSDFIKQEYIDDQSVDTFEAEPNDQSSQSFLPKIIAAQSINTIYNTKGTCDFQVENHFVQQRRNSY